MKGGVRAGGKKKGGPVSDRGIEHWRLGICVDIPKHTTSASSGTHNLPACLQKELLIPAIQDVCCGVGCGGIEIVLPGDVMPFTETFRSAAAAIKHRMGPGASPSNRPWHHWRDNAVWLRRSGALVQHAIPAKPSVQTCSQLQYCCAKGRCSPQEDGRDPAINAIRHRTSVSYLVYADENQTGTNGRSSARTLCSTHPLALACSCLICCLLYSTRAATYVGADSVAWERISTAAECLPTVTFSVGTCVHSCSWLWNRQT